MKKFFAKVFSLLMVAALCYLLAGLAFATSVVPAGDERLVLGAQTIDFGVVPEGGHSYTRDLSLMNNGGDTIAVDLSVQTYGDDSLDNAWKAADSWLVFVDARNHFEIAPGESATAGVRMMVPSEIAGGTYYATISAKTDAGETLVPIVVDITTDGYKKGGELAENSISPIVILMNDDDSICKAARAEVKSSGTARTHASYSLIEENAFGLADEKVADSNEMDVAQGGNRSLKTTECHAEKKGIVKVVQKVEYENAEGKTVVATLERRVLVLPLVAVIAVAVIVIALIALIVIIHKIRLKKLLKKKSEENEL